MLARDISAYVPRQRDRRSAASAADVQHDFADERSGSVEQRSRNGCEECILRGENGVWVAHAGSFYRTARRLFDGRVYRAPDGGAQSGVTLNARCRSTGPRIQVRKSQAGAYECS